MHIINQISNKTPTSLQHYLLNCLRLFTTAATSTQHQVSTLASKLTTQRSSLTSTFRSTAKDETNNSGLSGKDQVMDLRHTWVWTC